MSLLPLILLPLLLRYALRWFPVEPEPTGRLVWGVATVCALICTSIGTYTLSAFHMGAPPLDDDFREYCTTAAVLAGTLPEGVTAYALRPPFPQLPAALLAQFEGLADAMRHSAWLTTVIAAVVVFAWARLLGGLTAATVALISFPAFAPLATSAHQFTGYPQIALLYATAGLCLCLGMKRGGVWGAATCSVGAGLALLGDQFAFIWAGLPLLCGLWLAWRAPHRLRGLGAVLAPLVVSYGLARSLPPEIDFFPDDRKPVLQTLEQRLSDHDVFLESQGAKALEDGTAPGGQSAHTERVDHGRALERVSEAAADPGFYWGRAGPTDVWSAIQTITRNRNPSPSNQTVLEENRLAPRQTGTALGCILAGMIASAWLLRASVPLAIGSLLSATPFLLWLFVLPKLGPKLSPDFLNDTATFVLWLDHKLLLPGMIAAPVFLGVLWAALSGDASARPSQSTATWRGWVRPALATACVLVLVLGWLPSRLSPAASWRVQVGGNTGAIQSELKDARTTRLDSPSATHPMMPCRLRLAGDAIAARE